MLTFENYTYTRPDMDKLSKQFQTLLENFQHASSFEDQSAIMEQINALTRDYSTQENIMYIRSSIDTNDSFYQLERDAFDEMGPKFQALQSQYYKVLLATPFRRELEAKWGTQLFALAENAIHSYSDEVQPFLQQENKLISEYAKLIASAQIEFQGEILTLAQLGPYKESLDRTIRKEAMQASADFFAASRSFF